MVFSDSGFEHPETYDYVTALAREWPLDLHVVTIDPPLLEVLIVGPIPFGWPVVVLALVSTPPFLPGQI